MEKIVWVDVDVLSDNPKNRNHHPDDQIDRLAELIKYQGWRVPIIVSNQTGLIMAGHGRVMAAKKLGMKNVPVSYQDFETEEQAYAFLISDNSIASWAELDLSKIQMDVKGLSTDFKIEMLGLRNPLVEPEVVAPGCDQDEVPEVPKETICKLSDIWILGNHRLMCGDSTSIDAVENLMNGENAELCFTSPPYADQREYNGEKELSTQHLATFIRASCHLCKYYAINLGLSRKEGQLNTYWDDYITEARSSNLLFLSWNVWDKGECGSIGNQTAMFGISHEWIFVFGPNKKELNRTVENKSAGELANHNGNRQKDGTVKKQKDRIIGQYSQLKTIYQCTAQKARDEIDHPARFPVGFPEGYIEAMTLHGESIYEPFGGSGTTLIACEKTNRRCFMMEIDPHYCDVIVARWEKYSGKKATLLNA